MDRGQDIEILTVQIKRYTMKKNSTFLMILISALSIFFISWNIAESPPLFEQPVLITSAGQSADVQIGGVLAKRAGLLATLSKNATRQELKDKKTLALVIGVSMKGLGAAGLDLDQEKTRVKELLEEAQRKGIRVLCLHLGGESRRGKLSDQMIQIFLPYAQMAIVVKSGNKDGLFTQICKDKNIPLLEVNRASEAQKSLKDIFTH
jgi:hypothetical protein